MDIIRELQSELVETKAFPSFKSGDTITVSYKIKEGNKERIQQFQGVVIQRRGTGTTETFTVRKMSGNVGVERIFPISSPFIDEIAVNKRGAVRRASDFCKAFPEATFAMINKKRIKPNEIHSMELVGDVNGRNVVIVDDMADTLGTMKKAAELLIEKGAKSVRCIATHGILSGKAIENLYSSQITELLVSDSIPFINEKDSSRNEGRGLKQGPPEATKFKVISCADIIAKTIWSLTNKKSIHEEINVII